MNQFAKRVCMAAVLTMLLMVAVMLSSCESWSASSIEESKKRAEPIIVALEEYFSVHGTFPKRLEDLVPEYIEELPPPTAGTRQWRYKPRERAFSLSFGYGKDHYPNCTFSWSSSGKRWIVDQ